MYYVSPKSAVLYEIIGYDSLRGYCTPNLKLACFVCYLKFINTFLKK